MVEERERRTGMMGVLLMLLCAVCLCTGQFIWKCYNKVIALTEAKLCWGYKMALRDLPGRAEETCAESHS